MNRTTLSTLIGAGAALSVGFFAAKLTPPGKPSFSGKAVEAKANANGSASETTEAEKELARIVKSETGPKRWLTLLAQAEKATPEQMPALIRSAGDDTAMVRMLAARWAELDPMHMFGSLYYEFMQPEGAPGTLPGRWELTNVLFDQWAKKDPSEVIRVLSDTPDFSGRDNLRMNAVNDIFKSDVEKGLEAMKTWGIRNYSPDMKSVATWAERDPRHATEVIATMGNDYAIREAMKYVGKAWATQSPEEGLRYAASMKGGSGTTLASEIIREWAGRDLDSAVKFATAHESPSVRANLAPSLVSTWAKTDPAAALAWSQANLQGVTRTEAIAGLIKTAAEKDLTTASELVSNMEPGSTQNRACASIFETWFNKGKDQRDAAIAWLAELPEKQAREAALERVQWNWVWNDPAAVRDFVSGPNGSMASSSMISQVARSQTAKNPEAAMEWAANLPADRAVTARRAVFETWLQVRPEGATAYALQLPPGKDRDAAVTSISQTFMYQSTDQAIEWFKKLPATDRESVKRIIQGIPADPERRKQIEEILGRS